MSVVVTQILSAVAPYIIPVVIVPLGAYLLKQAHTGISLGLTWLEAKASHNQALARSTAFKQALEGLAALVGSAVDFTEQTFVQKLTAGGGKLTPEQAKAAFDQTLAAVEAQYGADGMAQLKLQLGIGDPLAFVKALIEQTVLDKGAPPVNNGVAPWVAPMFNAMGFAPPPAAAVPTAPAPSADAKFAAAVTRPVA